MEDHPFCIGKRKREDGGVAGIQDWGYAYRLTTAFLIPLVPKHSIMSQRKIKFYDILVYIAYAYFFLLGTGGFVLDLIGKSFNYLALIMMLVFGVQAYFRHRLTDLIIGVLALVLSIFMLLSSLEDVHKHSYNWIINIIIVTVSITSIIMSLILMFSYTKRSFQAEE
jgi:hypothetical protein